MIHCIMTLMDWMNSAAFNINPCGYLMILCTIILYLHHTSAFSTQHIMYSNERHLQTLRKLVFRPLQLMGIFPFSFDVRKRQFKKSNTWLALTLANIIFLLTILPCAYYNVIVYISYSGSQLSFLLVILLLTLIYVFELSIYIKICYHLKSLEVTANNVLKLFFVLLNNVDQIDKTVFKQIVNKIYFINITYCITTIAYLLVIKADSLGYELTLFWILYSTSPYRLLTVINFFVCAMMIEATLYDSINQRVTTSIKRLRQLDRNASYWTTHGAQKKALCKTVAREIGRLCRLHRIVTRTVHRTVNIFDAPIMLTILIEFFIIISEVVKDNIRGVISKSI